jgi:hypothetical protein
MHIYNSDAYAFTLARSCSLSILYICLTFLITDGIGTFALFYGPTGLFIKDGILYVSQVSGSPRIRTVNLATRAVATITSFNGSSGSQDGTIYAATFSYPTGIWVDASNVLYVADLYNYKIRKIRLTEALGTNIYGFGCNVLSKVVKETASRSARSLSLCSTGRLYV